MGACRLVVQPVGGPVAVPCHQPHSHITPIIPVATAAVPKAKLCHSPCDWAVSVVPVAMSTVPWLCHTRGSHHHAVPCGCAVPIVPVTLPTVPTAMPAVAMPPTATAWSHRGCSHPGCSDPSPTTLTEAAPGQWRFILEADVAGSCRVVVVGAAERGVPSAREAQREGRVPRRPIAAARCVVNECQPSPGRLLHSIAAGGNAFLEMSPEGAKPHDGSAAQEGPAPARRAPPIPPPTAGTAPPWAGGTHRTPSFARQS